MAISRRDFFRTAATGAVATAAIATFPEYVFAGEPRRGMAGNFAPPAGHGIILDSNENAYGAPESARAAMREALKVANRYPRDGAYENLIARIAKMNNVAVDQVMLGCGSGELLRSVVEAFAVPDKHVITPSPTFESLGNHAYRRGLKVAKVPLAKNFTHDLDAMAAAIKPETGLIYICNPNNPTASITPRKDIDAFLARIPANVTVIIDEAYHHFVSSPDYVSYLEKPSSNPRVVVLRTFSKVFGMAGLRVGYAVGKTPLMDKIRNCSFFDNVNCVAANAAAAALDDTAFMKPAVERNARDREEFIKQATKRNLPLIPSQANFVMIDSSRPVREVITHFKDNNVKIEHAFPPYETHVRISMGLPEEMTEFWRVWDMLPKKA